MKNFKLIVTPNENCLKVLKYLQKSITDINAMGVRVQVEKISHKNFDEDMVEILRRKGITRLPVLIAPDGASFIGVVKITELFERNIKNLKNGNRVSPAGAENPKLNKGGNDEMGTNPALTDFWMSEMYGGKDDNGRLIPKKDQDEGDDDRNDMDAKMRNYQSRVPRHRGGGAQTERNIEPAERPRRRRNAPAAQPVDNIADDHHDEGMEYEPPDITPSTPIRAPKFTPSEEGGDEYDQKMLNAWLDNNPNEF